MTIDPVSLEASKRVIEKIAPPLLQKISDVTREKIASIRIKLGLTFEDHLSSTMTRLSRLRTILAKEEVQFLDDIYVNLNLAYEKKRISDDELVDNLINFDRNLIVGTGGAGKSMLLRHMVTKLIKTPTGRIPVFIELRSIDFGQREYLERQIINRITEQGNKDGFYVFTKGLENGLFDIFLDGLDEIKFEHRDRAIESIENFSHRFPKCSITISSRPSSRQALPSHFRVLNLCGLEKDQAILVVKKSRANDALKSEFINKLDDGLYEKHMTFLENPLLVLMMLITFSAYLDIPDRMTVFYEQAFDALYALHDTVSKAPFKREHAANLQPDKFKKFLQAFCFISLAKEKYDFTYDEVLRFIAQALKISEVNADAEAVLKDLEESVCIMQQEGLKYIFVHRSFQEYFASWYALYYSGENQFDVIKRCLGNGLQHNTIRMMYEIDYRRLRRCYIIKALRDFEMLIGIESSVSDFVQFDILQAFYSEIAVGLTRGEGEQKALQIDGLTLNSRSELWLYYFSLSRIMEIPEPASDLSSCNIFPLTLQKIDKAAKNANDSERDTLSKLRDLLIVDNSKEEFVLIRADNTARSWMLRIADFSNCVDFIAIIRAHIARFEAEESEGRKNELEMLDF